MNKIALTIATLFITTIGFGQVLHTRYFNNEYLQREVPATRAKFAETAVKNPDGSITTEVMDIRKNEVVNSQTYKGSEPTGIWKHRGGSIYDKLEHLYVMDYSFGLVYSDSPCVDSIAGLKNYWEDNDTLKYRSPKISGPEKTVGQVLIKSIFYPDAAREAEIQGTVYITLMVDANGDIEMKIKKGTDILLDKEAMRVMRMLKFSSPPMLGGKPVPVCFTLPISFALE